MNIHEHILYINIYTIYININIYVFLEILVTDLFNRCQKMKHV